MIEEICKKAKAASSQLAQTSTEQRNNALCKMADSLEKNCTKILEANQKDVEDARARNIKEALIDRLILDKHRVTSALLTRFFLSDHLHTIVSAAVWANVMGKPQRMALRTRNHIRHSQAQIMRPAAISSHSRYLSLR